MSKTEYENLTEQKKQVGENLRKTVKENQEVLIQNIREIENVEIMVKETFQRSRELSTNLEQISQDLCDPLGKITRLNGKLLRVQRTTEVLRRVSRFLNVLEKMKSHLQGGSREYGKAAQCILELETIRQQENLNGIAVIDQEMKFVIKAGEEVRTNASRMLVQGLETQNSSDVASALHVFASLQTLEETVRSTLEIVTLRAKQAMVTAFSANGLDPSELTRSKTAGEQARSLVWSRLEKMFEILHGCSVQVSHLQRILTKASDASGHTSLLETLQKEKQAMFHSFWKEMCLALKSSVDQSNKSIPFLNNLFINDFPKLFRFFSEFVVRLESHHELKQARETFTQREITLLYGTLDGPKHLFLSQLGQKLSTAINTAFAKDLPSSEEVLYLVSVFSNELAPLRGGLAKLLAEVATIEANGIKILSKKAESFRTDAFGIFEKPTAAVLTNLAIYNAMVQFHSSFSNMVSTLAPEIQPIFHDALQSLEKMADAILTPLFQSLTTSLETCLAGIHKEDFFRDEPQPKPSNSIMQFQSVVHVFCSQYLSQVVSSSWIHSCKLSLVDKLTWFYLRQLSMVRPLSEGGRFKIATDIAQFELALSQMINLKDSHVLSILKAFKPLLFVATEKIADYHLLHLLPPSIVLHHIISRAHSSLISPHILKNMPLMQYSRWLDGHTEDEIFKMIEETLNHYSRQTNQKGEKEFLLEYPILLTLGPILLKNWSK